MAATLGTAARRRAGRRTRRSPFAGMVPIILVAVAYGVAAGVWVVAHARLPGGRWLAVHLFMLGVVSNLVLGFADHFARTLTRAATDRPNRAATVVFNLGAVSVLVGMTAGLPWVVAGGAATTTGAVVAGWVRIRRLRRQALGARFAWIVRAYERAHGAFVHGAVLGLLIGTGLVSGGWYSSTRLAHLHVNVGGWAVLTLLATLVFLGPTIARTRIRAGADDHAARALRVGATGLSVAVLLLFVSGVGGSAGAALRVAAAAGLGVFAWAGTVTCRAVGGAAAGGAGPPGVRGALIAVCGWLPAVLWADVVVVATDRWELLDALGVAVLLGVLAQTIVTVLGYLAPMLRGRTGDQRTTVRRRLARGGRARTVAYNLGVATLAAAATVGPAAGPTGAVAVRAGWVLVLAALTHQAAAVLRPSRGRRLSRG